MTEPTAAADKIDMRDLPLEVADRTFNTSHPAFRLWMSDNIPGKFYTHGGIERALLNFPGNVPFGWYRELVTRSRLRYLELGFLLVLDCAFSPLPRSSPNPVVSRLVALRRWGRVRRKALARELDACRQEIRAAGDSAPMFERVRRLDDWVAALNRSAPGQFYPGSVSEDDGLFLYWLVRHARPRTIVQTGVCNGLSTAYMALALEHNGGEGVIHAIDLPHVYDPDDPQYQRPVVYGVIIPPGKRSGWIATECFGGRVRITEGAAEDHLPRVLEEAGPVDLFYHDSDHSYGHMTWEMETALPFVREGGLIVCDDVGWNTATWDFARQHGLPAFNFHGSMGVIFR